MLYPPSVISLIPRKKKKKLDTYSTILYSLYVFFNNHNFALFGIHIYRRKRKPTYEKIHTILLSKKERYIQYKYITVSYLYWHSGHSLVCRRLI